MSINKFLSILDALKPIKEKRKKEKYQEHKKRKFEANKILRDLDFIFDPEKDHYEPKKVLMTLVIIIFDMKVQEINTKH